MQARFFNLTLLDIKLPDMEGVEQIAPLKEMHPDIVVIMVTAYASLDTAVKALNKGVSVYIIKPVDMDEVLATVREALEKQRLVMENRRLLQSLQQELAERKRAENERKRIEARLAQAQKMEAIGTLVGGIAYDFNNILFPIIGYAEMMLDDFPEDSPHRNNTREPRFMFTCL